METGTTEEGDALSRIPFLRGMDQPESEWLNAISSDQTLRETIGQRIAIRPRVELRLPGTGSEWRQGVIHSVKTKETTASS